MPALTAEVSFACPACTALQQVSLILLARSGVHRCTACNRNLKAGSVSNALHAGPPIRTPRGPSVADGLPGTRTRLLP